MLVIKRDWKLKAHQPVDKGLATSFVFNQVELPCVTHVLLRARHAEILQEMNHDSGIPCLAVRGLSVREWPAILAQETIHQQADAHAQNQAEPIADLDRLRGRPGVQYL